jgi:hypothetical protein
MIEEKEGKKNRREGQQLSKSFRAPGEKDSGGGSASENYWNHIIRY